MQEKLQIILQSKHAYASLQHHDLSSPFQFQFQNIHSLNYFSKKKIKHVAAKGAVHVMSDVYVTDVLYVIQGGDVFLPLTSYDGNIVMKNMF